MSMDLSSVASQKVCIRVSLRGGCSDFWRRRSILLMLVMAAKRSAVLIMKKCIGAERPERLGASENAFSSPLDRQRSVCISNEHYSQLPWSMGRWLAGCLIQYMNY